MGSYIFGCCKPDFSIFYHELFVKEYKSNRKITVMYYIVVKMHSKVLGHWVY